MGGQCIVVGSCCIVVGSGCIVVGSWWVPAVLWWVAAVVKLSLTMLRQVLECDLSHAHLRTTRVLCCFC